MACSQYSLQSFPVGLTFPVTPSLYTSILEPISLDFQWSTRTTGANFTATQTGRIDEPTSSTLRYSGKTYTLDSVQLTDPTHKSWIIPSNNQQNNYEDIIFTFVSGNLVSGSSEHITIVIPIIRVPLTTDPAYFTSFGTTNNSSVSLSSLIPKGSTTTFAYYSTCAQSTGLGTPNQNILNIISVDGLPVVDVTMARIKTIFMNQTSLQTYGGYVPPITVNYLNTPVVISSSAIFTVNVNSTNNISVPPTAGAGPITVPVEETTDAYKCVPFDPEEQIVNGKIKVDPKNGKVLTQVQDDRKKLIQSYDTNLTPSVYSKYVATALAFFFTVIVIMVIIYVLIGAMVGPSVVGHGGGFFSGMYKNLTNVPAFLIIGLLCGFIGFMIGMVIKYQK